MFSFFQSVILTVLIAFLIRFFVLQPFVVEGSSMEPNFHNNQYIIIDKVSYRFREPSRGEVIVFHPPTDPSQNYIKRIIGLPGETVTITDNEVFVNGTQLSEPYLGVENHNTEQFATKQPVTLGKDQFFVMGDNRSHSSDSREWGLLNREEIEGKSWFIVFPLSNMSFIHKPDYGPALTYIEEHVSLTP